MSAKHTFKVVLVGDGGVGKTSLRNQYVHKRFAATYKATIGADFLSVETEGAGGKRVLLQVWDTAGQERFASLGTAFYRGADACVLVYSVSSYPSFASLDRWRKDFLLHASPADPAAFPFIVVGNKSDLSEDRAVTRRQAQDWARRVHRETIEWEGNDDSLEMYPCLESSAKEGVGVEDVFAAVAQRVRIPQLTLDMYGDDGYGSEEEDGLWRLGDADSRAGSVRIHRTRSRKKKRGGACC